MPVRSGAGQGVDSRLWYNNRMNTRICPICQREFTSKRSNKICFARECQRIAYSQTFCLIKVSETRTNKAYRLYGKDWITQSRQCRDRDNYTCQRCGKMKANNPKDMFDVHHIVPFRKFNGDYKKANQLENLIYLCRICHKQAEREIRLVDKTPVLK